MLPRPFARPAADWKVLCAGGHDTPQIAEGHDVTESSEKFAALYQLLTKHNVRIAMAGDTHDFEYYREKIAAVARV
jgi:hypothetical protein